MNRRDKKLIKQITLQIKSELNLFTPYKPIRNRSERYNLKSTYKQGEEVLVLGYKGTIHLLLGKSKKKNAQMNYLIELNEESETCHWSMTPREMRKYGCNPLKRYKIALESFLKKIK